MSSEGTINLKLEGVSFQEVERCRKIMHELFQNGVFTMKSGKVILHFDHNAELGRIDFDYVKWVKNKKSLDIANNLKNAKIEITP